MKSVFQKMKVSLQRDLIGFGLNPEEWILNEWYSETITKQNQGNASGLVKNIFIENARDKNFKFKGEARFDSTPDSTTIDWVRLHLDPTI